MLVPSLRRKNGKEEEIENNGYLHPLFVFSLFNKLEKLECGEEEGEKRVKGGSWKKCQLDGACTLELYIWV